MQIYARGTLGHMVLRDLNARRSMGYTRRNEVRLVYMRRNEGRFVYMWRNEVRLVYMGVMKCVWCT